MDWPSLISLVIAVASAAYSVGALRQRIGDNERRLDKIENAALTSNETLQEIRDRVVAIDEWRKHVKS